ncbi:hypothetical protein SAMN05421677_11054 [Halobacillus aidingensis]|uniref:Uncharacterized protein n=1 Tax=Halobacillus aidingensis TaxID=240303 RepID=A0A1H0P3H2_HALAD|nr:hypothetical protein SAMN05421677_11054 [Halobacillus aidingensis]
MMRWWLGNDSLSCGDDGKPPQAYALRGLASQSIPAGVSPFPNHHTKERYSKLPL